MYGCGVAAAASRQDDTIADILANCRTKWRGKSSLWHRIGDPNLVSMFDALAKLRPGIGEFDKNAVSRYLFDKLQPEFRGYVSGESEFRSAFNRFEYLAALSYLDQEDLRYPSHKDVWGPHGLFVQRGGAAVVADLQKEIDREGSDMPLLKGGAFNGSLDRLRSVKTRFDTYIEKHARAMGYGW